MTGANEIVTEFLLTNGLPANLKGYHYAKEGIIYVIQEGCFESNKLMLTTIAERVNTAKGNIERCIRTLINAVWKNKPKFDIFETKPSVRTFIMKCAEYLTLKNPHLIKPVSYFDGIETFATDFTHASVYDTLAR